MAAPRKKVLVVEGGGMRGAYAAGALVGLHGSGAWDFDEVYATSSGAASAAYAHADQPEGLSIWQDHLHGRRLVHPLRFLRGGSALDLDYLIDEVFRRRVPLDPARLRARGRPLFVPVTHVETGRVRYYDLTREDPFAVLRAAMSLPGATLAPVQLPDGPHVDGGVVDQVPLRRALEAGATDLTVVLTRGNGYRAPPIGAAGLWLATRAFPGIRPALRSRHRRYNDAMDLLEHPPAGVRVRVLRPSRALPVQRWTTRRERLLEAIRMGLSDAARHASEAAGRTTA